MKSTFIVISAVCLFVVPVCWAHVGSPDVYYDGMAGPYRLFVTVRTPLMIPGIAQIEVRALEGNVSDIQIVSLRVIGEGSQDAPPPDRMEQSKSDSHYFTGKLWLMESGSWQVRMEVSGPQGKAEMAVPVPAFAQRTLRMQKTTGTILLGMMLLLVFSFISIFGVAFRASQLDPGAPAPPENRRRARIVMMAAAVATIAILFLGNSWWDSEANARASGMVYKAPPVQASLVDGDKLQLKLGFSSWHDQRKAEQLVKIIPDHGHLMHLFLIRMPEMDQFYHLHPEETGSDTFTESLPATASGQYALFGDIVRESGFPDTMTAQLTLPDVSRSSPSPLAGDDSGTAATPISKSQPMTTAPLEDGGRVEWLLRGQTLQAKMPVLLRFRVENSNGQAANDLEPYMGMSGHLVVVRRDLSVFAHVHPLGSVPMAAVMLLERQQSANKDAMQRMHPAAIPPEITFPWGFPQAGDYRLFMQVKRAGRVETAVFDTHVAP